jgi:hypothetical protein
VLRRCEALDKSDHKTSGVWLIEHAPPPLISD